MKAHIIPEIQKYSEKYTRNLADDNSFGVLKVNVWPTSGTFEDRLMAFAYKLDPHET